MKTKKLFLCMLLVLLSVATVKADKYYKVSYTPQNRFRVSTLEPGKKYMIFNTAHSVDGSQDRTGFVYNNGVGLSLDKSRDNAVLVYNECFVFTLEAVDEGNKKYALKSLSSGTYVDIEGSTSNTTQQPLYIYPWDDAVAGDAFNQDTGVITENNGIKQAFINSENENYTVVFYNAITSENNKTFVISNEDKNRYWNGNIDTFAPYGDGHPYAFYEVEEVYPETFPELNLRDLHIYSRCDIYSAHLIYGYIKSAQQITAGESNCDHLLDGNYHSYTLASSYEINLAQNVNTFSLYMHRRASGKNSFSSFKLQVLPVGESDFVDVGTFETTFASDDEYLHTFTTEELGGREFTKVKIVSVDGEMMGLAGLYLLPNTNIINNAFVYFDNSLPVSGTYQEFNAILERYNNNASEAKLLSGVPIPGNKYRIFADAYSNADYVNRHISTDGVNGNALVATVNYHSAGDKSAFEWICYQTSDGSLLFRNSKYNNLFLGNGVVTTNLNEAKWTINTNKTQRYGVPLVNKENKYLAVKNDGLSWNNSLTDVQNQTLSEYCTDFVFIPVPLGQNEKRITILASELAQRNISLSVGGVEYSIPFSLLFSNSDNLPVLTELAAETHKFVGYQLKKGKSEFVDKGKVFDKALYNSLESGDTLIAKLELVEPFEKSNNDDKKLYRIKNMRAGSISQQVAPHRASSVNVDIEIEGGEDGGPISPSAGNHYFASFDTKNTNMSLQKEDGLIDAFELFYFTGGENTEDYYSALINSVVTTKKCKAANEWTDAGQVYYIQPNTSSDAGYTGYSITRTILNKDNNPSNAWCSNHDGVENAVIESNANSDGAIWVFEEVDNADAVAALHAYIDEQHEVLHAELQKDIAENNPLYCPDKINAYYKYIHKLAEDSKQTDDVAKLVAWSQEIHMLHHEIEYNLLALPTPTDESNGYNPAWYYVKNVYSGDYATYNGGEKNMQLCERNSAEEQTLYNLFNFAGEIKEYQTIDEYLEVHIHNLMAKKDSTLVGKNIELFSTSFEGRGVTNDPVPNVTKISKDDVWEITAEFKSNGTGANYWGTALLATGDNSVADNYANGFQIYLQSDGDLCLKAGDSWGREYLFEHTRGAYSTIKVVLTYAENRLKVKVTNSLGVTMSLSDIGTDRKIDYIECPDMADITKFVTNMPKTGVGITSLKAESVSAMTWNAHNAEKDTWYILPSTNEYYRGLSVVMNSPHVTEMGWASQPTTHGDVDVVFTDLGSANQSTWLFEKVTKFDSHIDQLLEVYNVNNGDFVIYNKEYAKLCATLSEKAALIKAGDDDTLDEKYFNEAVDAIRKYLGPDLSALTAPRPNALYTIRPVAETNSKNALLVYVDKSDAQHVTKEVYLNDAIRDDYSYDSRAAWVFEGTVGANGLLALDGLKVKNLHTQCYLTALGADNSMVSENNAASVTLGALGACTTQFKVGEQYMAMNGTKVTNKGDADTKWIIEEIQNPEKSVYFETKTNDNGHSTLMLGFPATIPGEVEAFYGSTHGKLLDGRYLSMTSYEGGILPANTPVVLRNKDFDANNPVTIDNLKFYYSTKTREAVEDNYLYGSLYWTLVKCSSFDDVDGDGTPDRDVNIYMLKSSGTSVKMFWVYENYTQEGLNTGNNDEGGYVTCKANKAYMVLPKELAGNIASYSFRFDDGTTDIEDVENENVELNAIYDLQGRKLENVTAPGVYIVNGKKLFVK